MTGTVSGCLFPWGEKNCLKAEPCPRQTWWEMDPREWQLQEVFMRECLQKLCQASSSNPKLHENFTSKCMVWSPLPKTGRTLIWSSISQNILVALGSNIAQAGKALGRNWRNYSLFCLYPAERPWTSHLTYFVINLFVFKTKWID